jgi:hypothetical protein
LGNDYYFNEVDAMTKNEDAINSRPGPLNLSRAASNNAENQVTRALETLRLLNDKNNPLSLRQAIEHARNLAQTFALWEQSGTLIKDIVVRLSDGQEIAVDQSNVSNLCGLHFRNAFPADSVLHVWKKADDQFGEVPLLSLSLRDVHPNGYQYENTYKNGQTLSLNVTRYADGQFYISVDCSAKERAMTATPRAYAWLGLLGPLAVALFGLGSSLRRSRMQPIPQWFLRPSAAFAAGLMFATAGCLLLLRGSSCEADFNQPRNISSAIPSHGQNERQQSLDLLKAALIVQPAAEVRDEDGAKQGRAAALENVGGDTRLQAFIVNRNELSIGTDRSNAPATLTSTEKVVADAGPGAARDSRGAKTGETRTLARARAKFIDYGQSSPAASNYPARTGQVALIVRTMRVMDQVPRGIVAAGRTPTPLVRAGYARPSPAQPLPMGTFSTAGYSVGPNGKP